MRLDQKQFETAVDIVSAEWPGDWFANTADDTRVTPDDSVISKRVGIPSSEISTDVLSEVFRTLFNAFNNSARGLGTHNSPMSAVNRKALGIADPDEVKPIVSYLTSKEIWDDATHHFSLRDPRTHVGFDVFSGPNGQVQVVTTWRMAA